MYKYRCSVFVRRALAKSAQWTKIPKNDFSMPNIKMRSLVNPIFRCEEHAPYRNASNFSISFFLVSMLE